MDTMVFSKHTTLNKKINTISVFIREKFNNKNMFLTSSFQTQSIPLIHILHKINPDIPVYFINTGYHFPETLRFKRTISDMYSLNVINLNPDIPKSQQKDHSGNLLFTSDPDYCCDINKVYPIDKILRGKDVWINGIKAEQNEIRRKSSQKSS